MRYQRELTLLWLLVLTAAALCNDAVPSTLPTAPAETSSSRRTDEQRALTALYAHDAPTLWLRQGQLSPQAKQLLAVLRDAEQYGLQPQDYEVRTTTADEVDTRFDRELSTAAL